MKRKLFSAFTALALCLSLLPAPALALEEPEPQGQGELQAAPAAEGDPAPQAEGDPDGSPENPWPCGDNVTVTLVDGVLTFEGEGAMTDSLVLSSYRPWHAKRSIITSAVIGEGITSIGESILENLYQLTSVQIASTVTSISQRAFWACQKLSSITLPAGLTSIEYGTFAQCKALTSIEIPASVETIGGSAFGGSGLTQVTIPDGVTSIGEYAFNNCASLTTVEIPASVKTIGYHAFANSPNAEIHYDGTTEQWNTITGGNSGAQTDKVHTSDSNVVYRVTIVGGGTDCSGSGPYKKSVLVEVSAGTKDGQAFTGWTVSPEGLDLGEEFDASKAKTSFYMPEQDITLTANWAEAVAEVDGVRFADLQKAFDYATNPPEVPGAIYLLKDVTVDQPITMSQGNVVLWGKKKTITGTGTEVLEVTGGKLSLQEVTVKNTYESGWGISAHEGSPSITILGAATVSGPACGIHQEGGTLTVNGTVEGTRLSGAGIDTVNTTLTIKEGAVISGSSYGYGVSQGSGTLTINGGTISGGQGLLVTALGGKDADVHLKGGTFIGSDGNAIVATGVKENPGDWFPPSRPLSELLESGYTIYKADGTALTAEELESNKTGSGTFTVDCAHASVGTVTSSGPDGNGVVTVGALCDQCKKYVTLGTLTMVNDGLTITYGDEDPTFEVRTSEGLTVTGYKWTGSGVPAMDNTSPTITPFVAGAGELNYTCKVTFNVPGGTASADLKFTLTVKPLDISKVEWTVTIKNPEKAIYNGKPQKITTLVAAIKGNENDTFGEQQFDIQLVDASGTPAAEQTDAGTYQIQLTGTAPLTGSVTLDSPTFTIEKATPSIAWKNPAAKTVTYNGQVPDLSSELTVTLISGEIYDKDVNGAFSYSYAAAENGSYTSGLPKDAGTYYVKASLPAKGNYTSAETAAPLTLTIQKVTTTVTAPMAADPTYDGTPKSLVTAAKTNAGEGAVQYALHEGGPWSTDLPTAVDAGNYTVYYKVDETKNYTGVEPQSVEDVTLLQADFPTAMAERTMYIQNGKEAEYTLDLEQYAPTPPAGQHFGPGDSDVPSLGGEWVYEIKDSQYLTKDDISANGWTMTVKVNKVDSTDEKDVAVITVRCTSNNFKPIEMKLTIKAVNKTPVTISGVAAAGWTYDGTAHPGYTGTPSGGAYTGAFDVAYSKQDGTKLDAAPKDAGEYTVTFSMPGDQDYVGSTKLSFTVEQAEITVKADDKTAVVGAALPELTWRVVSGLAAGETLKTDPVPACDADMSEAGTYPITISGGAVPDGGNYKAQLVYQDGTLTVNPAGGGGSSTVVKVTGITLDRDALTLAAGETGRLSAVVRPAGASDKRVLWSTSDLAIVSVDSEGNLTARAPGTAVITVTSRDGGFTASCTVTVTGVRYVVAYRANGGSGAMPNGSALGTFVLPECGFAPPEGQEFDCWAVGGVNGPRVSAGETYLFTADTEVYALWRTPRTYRAVFLSGGGEGAAITMEKLSWGAVIRLPENPFRREGHTFTGWGYGSAVYDAGADFTMPDRDVTFTAQWKAATSGGGSSGSGGGGGSVEAFFVTVKSTEHGKVTSSRNWAGKGSTVTLTVKPDSGYALDALTVTDSRGQEVRLSAQSGGKYAFTMPGGAVTVKAAFAPLPEGAGALCGGGEDCPSHGFRDLGGVGTWYHEAVDYVLRNGLMNGYSVGFFGPDNRLTRAQLVQILYNHAGRPAAAGGGGFTDVAADAWCAPAIAWAAERGIAGGYGNGIFGPDDPITREQLAVMLWRYAGSPAASQELRFHDTGKIEAYAWEAVAWAAESGVMNGRSDGALDPKGLATRAQTAQMLKNLLENG